MPPLPGPLGVVVGLAAEARLAAPLGGLVEAGGGTPTGAERAVQRLLERGVRTLLSFGLGGGLDPTLRPGVVIVPEAVLLPRSPDRAAASGARLNPTELTVAHEPEWASTPTRTTVAAPMAGLPVASLPAVNARPISVPMVSIPVDLAFAAWLGGSTGHRLLAGTGIVASAEEKRGLHEATGAAAVDLESGAVAGAAARHGLPFAVLRVICDPAERDLPQAALAALSRSGAIRGVRVLGSIIRQPGQIPALLALAADAAAARRALTGRVAAVGQISTSS